MRILIIEDEQAASRRLEKMLLQIDKSIEVLEYLDSVEDTLLWFKENETPELIFLDIHLADGSSFEIFKHFKIDCPIIFTTAYDQYAIQTFKVNTIDYLLKPIKRPELENALAKHQKLQKKDTIDYQKLAAAVKQQEQNHRFLIRFGQSLKVVEISEVAYFYTRDKITFLMTFVGKRYPIDNTLEQLENITDRQYFFRINRQFIIHLKAIKEMFAYSKSRVKIELQPKCDLETIVSTERSPHFKKWLVGGSA